MEEKGKTMQQASELEKLKALNWQVKQELADALDPKKKKKK